MCTPAKKMKSRGGEGFEEFLKSVEAERHEVASSVMDFPYNKKRVRVLSEVKELPESSNGVLYWMTREQRVQDNWSLLFAQKLAIKNQVPLHVCFCLLPKYMDATIRQYRFLLQGLEEVSLELKHLEIPFHLILCSNNVEIIRKFVTENDIGAVVLDFSPLKISTSWGDQLKESLPDNIPLCQVDGHNIVPCWIASNKLEYGARTIRNKINSKLDEFLTKFPPVIKHPFKSYINSEKIEWTKLEKKLDVDMKVNPVDWAKPGYRAGMQTLFEFCDKRLQNFATKRNNPLENALSNLSTWFHFGQVSVQRCILYVQTFKSKYKDSVSSFCEEAIVRRELADNFCFYNNNYDNLDGAYDWAKKTLNDHKKDKRTWIYMEQELEGAKTHDDLWNSAQIQLNTEGKMHGFLRMYWAKKILEWTQSPEEALRIALYLNDKYSLDGRDPNGFVGCMWSICGIHDQGWKEREIFGKIRYMNYQGCARKFDVKAFVARYGGKVYGQMCGQSVLYTDYGEMLKHALYTYEQASTDSPYI